MSSQHPILLIFSGMGDYFISRNDSIVSIKNIYTNILNDTDFTNVTLACEYGKQLRAHNVILSASSPYFRTILLNNNKNDALINLRGVDVQDLKVRFYVKHVFILLSFRQFFGSSTPLCFWLIPLAADQPARAQRSPER